MSFEAEWSALVAGAAERSRTRLNSAEPSPARGGDADLVVSRDDLGAIGHDAYVLHSKLSRDGDHARPSTFNVAISLTNDGFTSGPALLKLHDRWSTQHRTLLDACAQISNHLDYSKASHKKDDDRIAGDLTRVSVLNEYIK
ncbi:hypothetical protein ACFY7Z_03645 [Streptomyces sp. NPDC012623]|uniref:hypothetical protein n=1 Tax=unclassified Streptomyces TaxID=2593676 RepID=UPI0036C779A3